MDRIIFRLRRMVFFLCFVTFSVVSFSQESAAPSTKKGVDVKEIVLGHIKDSYEWHITTWGKTKITLSLPVIVRDVNDGQWHVFSSSHLYEGNGIYDGFKLATSGSYEGKLVQKDSTGQEVRPIDLSLTKTALALLINSLLLCLIIVSCGRWAKRNPNKAPGGFTGFMEMFIMSVNDDIIEPCIGPKYKKFAPYLQTVFFFIFINNLMGLIPIFPGGANVTGNIAITFFLAICTFLITNVFAVKAYWKDIFWPHVPIAIKPIMIPIEIFGIFTKPFALMIRLFANIMAGHAIILSLVCLIFITSASAAICVPMTFVSVTFSIFMDCLELLVAWIQAYVFTMLSAVFIGLAIAEEEPKGIEAEN